MKVLLSWLQEYLPDLTLPITQLTEQLLQAGFETDSYKKLQGQLNEKVISVKVLTITQHPNAQKLKIVRVFAGKEQFFTIVTAAQNLYPGAVVPLALIGATLYDGTKIEQVSLRGVISEGMFCSGKELGINNQWYPGAETDGILILNSKTTIGKEITKILNLEDYLLEIEITANRKDCNSVYGLAREIAHLLNLKLKQTNFNFNSKKINNLTNNVLRFKHNTKICSFYSPLYLDKIKIKDSPLWLRRRLCVAGIKSKNNLVDLTNYIAYELGQPLHAFDYDKLSGSYLEANILQNSLLWEGLGNNQYELQAGDIVIKDKEKIVALAGIIGGNNSCIDATTIKKAVIETAIFNKNSIQQTAQRLKINSDASIHFSYTIPFETTILALKRTLKIIQQEKLGEIYFNFPLNICKKKNNIIVFNLQEINKILGLTLTKSELKEYLKKTSFKLLATVPKFKILLPYYREDIVGAADIAEEIIRIYGYSKLSSSKVTNSNEKKDSFTNIFYKELHIKNYLIAHNFYEIRSSSLSCNNEDQIFNYRQLSQVDFLNPLTEDKNCLRTNLIKDQLKAITYNYQRQIRNGSFFELAPVYYKTDFMIKPQEQLMLALSYYGEKCTLLEFKKILEDCFSLKNLDNNEIVYEKSTIDFLHPGRSVVIKHKTRIIGIFGQISYEISARENINCPILIAELDYSYLNSLKADSFSYQAVSKYPCIERDLSFILEKKYFIKDIMETIKNNAGNLLEEINLIDVYHNINSDKGKQSVTFKLIFRSFDHTLTKDEVDPLIKKIITGNEVQYNGELRDC